MSGGGYLAIDAANGRYVGAVSLKVGTVTVQGVGVLETRIPGGGWSLIALAEVDGLTIQLGFGIQLTGIGILVGIDRTMDVTRLQELTRSGRLQNILFPADMVANAPRVAADLDSVFPPAHAQYVVGPVLKLTWGPGPILTAQIAVLIELPKPVRVAVLGVIRLAAPNPTSPTVDIHLDVLGVLDLQQQTISLDISLSHSTIAGMPLTGQAALRGGWGASSSFVLAIGGFNPSFHTPAGFPALERIGLLLGSGTLTVRMAAYLAVTSNTLQLGSRVDLHASAGPAALTASASFDALLQFKPFHLEIDIAIHAAVTLYGDPVMALDITAHLSGPGPWQVHARVHFSVLFFSFTIAVSGTFGPSITAAQPAPVDILTPLATAVGELANWALDAPAGSAAVSAAPAQGR